MKVLAVFIVLATAGFSGWASFEIGLTWSPAALFFGVLAGYVARDIWD